MELSGGGSYETACECDRVTPSESYEEWLEMVREEDERNRQAFTGERPLTVTEFIHRKRWVDHHELMRIGEVMRADADAWPRMINEWWRARDD